MYYSSSRDGSPTRSPDDGEYAADEADLPAIHRSSPLLSDSKHNRIVQWTHTVATQASADCDADWDGRSESSGAVLLDALQELDSVQLAQLYLRATEAADEAEVTASAVVNVNEPHDSRLTGAELADIIAEHLRRRDKELELAARAGQELLQRNAVLAQDLSMTAAERDALEHQSAQLRHDIAGKEQLLRMYMLELNEIQDSAGTGTAGAMRARDPRDLHRALSPSAVSVTSQGSVGELSDVKQANEQLAEQMEAVKRQTEEMERRERELIAECVRQVKDTAEDVRFLHEKTSEREIVTSEHAEELARLREQNRRLEESQQVLVDEKQELQGVLSQTRDQQEKLASQVSDLQAQYLECISLFRQASHELSEFRRHGPSNQLAELSMPEEGEPYFQPRKTQSAASQPGVPLSEELKTVTRHSVAEAVAGEGGLRPVTPEGHNESSSSLVPPGDENTLVTPTQPAVNVSPGSKPLSQMSPSLNTARQQRHSRNSARRSRTPKQEDPSSALKAANILRQYSKDHGASPVPRVVLRTPLLKSINRQTNNVGLASVLDTNPSDTPATRSPLAKTPRSATSASRSGVENVTPTSTVTPSAVKASKALQSGESTPLQQSPSLSRPSSSTKDSPSPSRRASRPTFGRGSVRMVKPMEGSMTLLKWHLLAMQQPTDTLAVQQHLPGVHIKRSQTDAETGTASPKGPGSPGGGASPAVVRRDSDTTIPASPAAAAGKLQQQTAESAATAAAAAATASNPSASKPVMAGSRRIVTRNHGNTGMGLAGLGSLLGKP